MNWKILRVLQSNGLAYNTDLHLFYYYIAQKHATNYVEVICCLL